MILQTIFLCYPLSLPCPLLYPFVLFASSPNAFCGNTLFLSAPSTSSPKSNATCMPFSILFNYSGCAIICSFLLPSFQTPHLTALQLSKANCSLSVHPSSNRLSHLVISIFLCPQFLCFVHLCCYEHWSLNMHPHYAKQHPIRNTQRDPRYINFRDSLFWYVLLL